jgi:DnaJ homologue, subfamily C, member 28, conserved domain
MDQSRFESLIDRQIREAQERGEFDDLPGAGKPLPDRGELYDEEWWLKQLIEREKLTGLAPATLQIRKEAEELMDRLGTVTAEAEVRHIVTRLNERIELARRGLVDGPSVVLPAFDVEDVVSEWRAAR